MTESVKTFFPIFPNVAGAVTYNLFIDNDGEINFLVDDRVTNLTPSLEEIISSEDKLIISQIIATGGSFTSTTDYRRYVNNLDNKIELVVEDGATPMGSFGTLDSAVNWINASSNFIASKTIKIDT